MLNEPEASPPVPTTSTASGGALDAQHLRAHGGDRAGDLLDRLAAHAQRHEQAAHLRGGGFARHHLLEGAGGLLARERRRRSRLWRSSALNVVGHGEVLNVPWRCALPVGLGRAAPPRAARSTRSRTRRCRENSSTADGRAPRRCSRDGIARHAPAGADVSEPHDEAVLGIRRHGQILGQARALDHERMVARRLEGRVDAAEDAGAGMADRGELAVHRRRRAHHPAAESVADRLMAEADAEDRDCCRLPPQSGRGRCRPLSGVHGPGESTIASGSAAMTAALVILSLRCTRTARHPIHRDSAPG